MFTKSAKNVCTIYSENFKETVQNAFVFCLFFFNKITMEGKQEEHKNPTKCMQKVNKKFLQYLQKVQRMFVQYTRRTTRKLCKMFFFFFNKITIWKYFILIFFQMLTY